MLAVILLAAEQNILQGFSGLDRDAGPRGSEHAPKLRERARQQAIHRAADAPLQEAQTRRVLELLLQPAQPLGGPAHEALGLPARCLGRPFRLLPRPFPLGAGASRPAPRERAEGVLRLGQLAGARGRTRRGETRWPVVVRDPEPQRATPLDGLKRAKLLRLGPQHRDGSLGSDPYGSTGEARPGRGRISIDARERGVEALGALANALHRSIKSLQALAGRGEFLISARPLGFEGGEALMFVEGLGHLLRRGTQGLAGARGRLTLRVRNAETLLQPTEREIPRHARGLHLLSPVGDHEPLALALEPEPMLSERRLELLPGLGRAQLREMRADPIRERGIPRAFGLAAFAARERGALRRLLPVQLVEPTRHLAEPEP